MGSYEDGFRAGIEAAAREVADAEFTYSKPLDPPATGDEICRAFRIVCGDLAKRIGALTPSPEPPRTAGDPDPCLVHELLHGASLAADLLETVGGGDVYAPVWAAAPEARRAFDAAVEAAAAFYGAMGQVSVGDPLRAPAAERPREGAAEGDGAETCPKCGQPITAHVPDAEYPDAIVWCPPGKPAPAAPASPGDGAKETP